jgi:plastocyanin
MRRVRSKKGIAALLGAAVSLLGAAQALGVTETIGTSPTCCTFTKTSYSLDPGQVATFSNAGDGSHDVTSTVNGPDGKKLFLSDTITSGTAPVNGTQFLNSGSYQFFCTVHPEMRADLVVGPGTPLARPDVEVKVQSTKIDKVVDSRKLKVRLTAESESDDVVLVAKKGARRLGSKQNIDLSDGASRTVSIQITGSGRNVLDDLQSAKVRVTATVPFGTPDSAGRKLN